jgi:asparagine synthase (glutamine-hydrolysing)
LYRDPTGQKLLYYYARNGKFIFSSEIKAILGHHDVPHDVNVKALSVALRLGYIPGDLTLFEHIQKLNVSEVVTYDLVEKKLTKEYFKSDSQNYFSDDTTTTFRELIDEHLQSKQKVAVNLSGGLDSSLLVHEMSEIGHEISTYTTLFEGVESFNTDAHLAKRLSKDYTTKHAEILVTPDTYYNNFIESYAAIEEPNYNISLPTYLQTAIREGSQGDKNRVILSGDGGDEVFGGYSSYVGNKKIDSELRWMTPFFFNLIKNKRNHTNLHYQDIPERWLFFRQFTRTYGKEPAADIKNYIHEIADPFLKLYAEKRGSVYYSMLMDRVLWMAGENFIRSDKLYMSQSLELRSPLSYHPFRLHMDRKLKEQEYINEKSNKLFLRKHYEGKLPDYITHRPDKSGWRAPIEVWYNKKFKNLYLDILSKPRGNFIDWPKVRQLVESKNTWPGKYSHLYLSLAILADRYNIPL